MSIALAIVALGLLIFVHELGHFLVAKTLGMPVEEFVLGFGPKLLARRIGGTVYGIAAFPLGGYVRFQEAPADGGEPTENSSDSADAEAGKAHGASLLKASSFDEEALWKRALVIISGPLMNLILAIVLITVLFLMVPVPTTTVAKVVPGSPAAEVGLVPGDRLVGIEGSRIDEWEDAVLVIRRHAGDRIELEVIRNQTTVVLTPLLEEADNGLGVLGVEVATHRAGILASIRQGFTTTISILAALVVAVIALFSQFGDLLDQLTGPIGIVAEGARAVEQSGLQFIWVLSLISLSLTVVNLLPIPPLDGGRLLFLGWETVRGRPLSKERLAVVQSLGFALLFALMAYVILQDISRLFA